MEKVEIDISVIVPIYRVEEYIEECLESLLRQGDVKLEVILVDDGSTDGSGAIAKRYAHTYEQFHYYYIQNGGLGHARNYGTALAHGKYLAYLDSDDVLTDGAYERLFRLAEKQGNELTVCNVARFHTTKTVPTRLHSLAFQNIERDTQSLAHPDLVYDTIVCNKLILRSFYLKHHFTFPEHMVYEDMLLSISMYYFAKRISVSHEVGYLWRVRDGAEKSITQNISVGVGNLQDRITAISAVNRFLEQNAAGSTTIERWKQKTLTIDLIIFINTCISVSAEQASVVMKLIREYLEANSHLYRDSHILDRLSVLSKQKYACLMENDREGLVRICEYGRNSYQKAAIKESGGRLLAQLPDELFTIKTRDVTEEIKYDIPRKYIDSISVSDGRIEICAHIYKQRVNLSDASQQKIAAYLYHEPSGTKIPLQVTAKPAKELTDFMGTVTDKESGIVTKYNYDGAGFCIVLSPQEMTDSAKYSGWSRILVTYENRFSAGSVILSGCSAKTKSVFHHAAYMIGGCVVRTSFGCLDELQIQSVREDIWAENLSVEKDLLKCELSHTADCVWAADNVGNQIQFTAAGHNVFSASSAAFQKAVQYRIYLKTGQGITKPLLNRKKELKVWADGEHAIVIHSLRTYETSFFLHHRITMIQKSGRNGDQMQLYTKTAGSIRKLKNATKARLLVEDKISGSPVILAKAACVLKGGAVRCRFAVQFSDKEMTKNFYQSIRDVYIEYLTRDGNAVREAIYMPNYFRYVFSYETLGIECYRILEGTLRISVAQVWKEAENSQKKREALTLKNYPLYRKEEINKKQILFESLWGSKYSCNPQALYEYIDAHYPEYECIWSFNDARTPIQGNGKRVRKGSQEYYHYLATAGYLVNNVNFVQDYVKRPGQVEIQTMHGTPLKTLGLEVPEEFPTMSTRNAFLQRCARWDYLIVQGEFMYQKRKDIYQFEKETLCTGYPRTDRLFYKNQKEMDKIKEKIKEKLALPKDKKIILYAPTYRIKNYFDMQLDLEKMKEQLSDDYILLIRIHHLSASGYIIPTDGKFIFDFNSYRYIEELYLISDILITDYSSVMFDYALLKKPMLFFVYDLEEYCGKLRGIYVDFRKEAPGPLLFHSDEVIAAILNLEEEMKQCKERIEQFYQKYLTYEGPDSCKKVVEAVLHPPDFSWQRILCRAKRKALGFADRKGMQIWIGKYCGRK